MRKNERITTLFLDIGGVLLTDGWNLDFRSRAAEAFDLDPAELENLHQQAFDTFELGKLTLDDYLGRVVFHRPRDFTLEQFKKFMFAQSKPYPQMLALVGQLKAKYGLRIFVVSNEGRELNEHRIRAFKLAGLVDAFVSSCYVHLRKPDPDIFRLALDLAQAPAKQVVYIENTVMFVRVAEGLRIPSILHKDFSSTQAELALFGLA
jgi:putative hydrolase of the HAD superfamily